MPGENIQDWSVTAANNSNSDTSINWAEGQPRASVNNSARSMMAAHAKNRNLQNGSIVTGGSANAQTFTSGVGFTAPIPTGLRVMLKIGPSLTNTGAATLEMDGLGAVAINNLYSTALSGSEIVADTYAEFLYDGTKWLLLRSSPRVSVQTFAASGTYTPSTAMGYCIIECVGSGGGGGGAVGDPAAPLTTFNGGGGGGGGYSRALASAATVGTSQVVTIGAAGAAGSAGSNGGAGGACSVGSLCIANGGSGGLGGTPSQLGQAGAGGAVGTGNIIAAAGIPGGGGFFSSTANVNIQTPSGNGGASFFGGGGVGVQNSNGNSGLAYGAGGSGAGAFNTGLPFSGGPGVTGLIIVTEFRT